MLSPQHSLQFVLRRFDSHCHVILHVTADLQRLIAGESLSVSLHIKMSPVGAVIGREGYIERRHLHTYTAISVQSKWALAIVNEHYGPTYLRKFTYRTQVCGSREQ